MPHLVVVPREAIEIVDGFTRVFPELNSSWYLIGSHALGDAVDVSDVDLVGLCSPLPVPALELARRLQDRFLGRVDLWLKHPDWLNRFPDAPVLPMLTHGILLRGQDLRSSLPPLNMKAYQESVAASFGQVIDHFHADRNVDMPPDPADEFLGYVDPAPGWTSLPAWTHGIVVLIGKAAAGIAAVEDRPTGSRADALRELGLCRSVGEWPTLCSQALALLRDSLRYRVPEAAAGRAQLRDICAQLPLLERLALDRLTAAKLAVFRVNR